jgi:hypothetical protein
MKPILMYHQRIGLKNKRIRFLPLWSRSILASVQGEETYS